MSRQLAVFLALGCAGVLAVLALSPSPSPVARAPGPKLGVGDPAPPFPEVEWLTADRPTPFEPGKVTVLDVWATWCGPCIQAMPELAELQRRYADRGVVVVPIASTARDDPAQVREFAQKNASLGLAFALAPGERVMTDFMAAAGRNSIPTTFVIDRQGKIAFVGHPADLGAELPAIVAR